MSPQPNDRNVATALLLIFGLVFGLSVCLLYLNTFRTIALIGTLTAYVGAVLTAPYAFSSSDD